MGMKLKCILKESDGRVWTLYGVQAFCVMECGL